MAPGVASTTAVAPGPAAIVTGENIGATGAAPQSCCRQRNNWLTESRLHGPPRTQPRPARSQLQRSVPSRRATTDGAAALDVITSTCVLVIGPSLGLVP
jgi:hypothetical protein